MPPSYIRVRAVSSVGVRPRTDTQTHRQTHVTTIHFASSTTHAKCNNKKAIRQVRRPRNMKICINYNLLLHDILRLHSQQPDDNDVRQNEPESHSAVVTVKCCKRRRTLGAVNSFSCRRFLRSASDKTCVVVPSTHTHSSYGESSFGITDLRVWRVVAAGRH